MSAENLFESIKENLNGRPGQPIVLGVCKTLSEKFDMEVWVFRAAAIVLGVFFTFAALAAYILFGLFMKETEARTKGVFQGLCIWAAEIWDKGVASFQDLTGHGDRHNSRP